jgi:hypothetical protein
VRLVTCTCVCFSPGLCCEDVKVSQRLQVVLVVVGVHWGARKDSHDQARKLGEVSAKGQRATAEEEQAEGEVDGHLVAVRDVRIHLFGESNG